MSIRIALTTQSSEDSMLIIDTPDAENLLGRGDMLLANSYHYSPIRLQGTFVEEDEIENLVEFWKRQIF